MLKILKSILFLITIITFSEAYEINDKVIYQKDFENNTIYLPLNNYRTLIFNERIKDIQLTNSENIRAEFIDNEQDALKILKVLGKNISNESAIVTLESGKTIQINFSIMQNLDSIISIVKLTYPDLIIEQANDTIILKGYVKDYKERDLVIDIFKKAGIKTDEKLVDMIETSSPTKMVRVKLYAVEIKKDEGLKLKNNWAVSSKNHQRYVFHEVLSNGEKVEIERNTPLGTVPYASVRDQYIDGVDSTIDEIMKNAVSLTGGLSGAANYLGKYFNVSLTLQYLADNGVANILDETTLITLENKEATFHAGGTIRLKSQASTAEGLPTTEIEKVKYGLQLKIKAKNVMRNNYIDLEITTSNSKIDWSNTVDNIPSFLENEVVTNIMAKNSATIVLGGLVNNNNSFDEDKIPLLGDIPVLGYLFKSKDFREGKSELVFFLTPEVVDPADNNQEKNFAETRKMMLDTSKYIDEDNILERSLRKNRKEKKEEKEDIKEEKSFFEKIMEPSKATPSDKEKHQQKVNEILGYK